MPQPKDEDGKVKYHAECAKGALTAARNRDDELKALEKKRIEDERHPRRPEDNRFRPLSDTAPTLQWPAGAREAARSKTRRSTTSSPTKRSKSAPCPPRGSLDDLDSSHQRDPIKAGTAYLYFFPQGFTERSQVVVRQGPNAWTLVVSSLTGKVTIANDELEVPKT